MAAPTPVSALVHSRTLVTAGVYILLRYNQQSTEWLVLTGAVTIIIAGLSACYEMDLKKVVALSTLSQLGVMFVALGLAIKPFCFFHLMTHALFKSLLFICVGVFIHNTFGGQDHRSFSSLAKASAGPVALTLVANLSLIGFPFFAGFYRKDLILELAYGHGRSLATAVALLVGVGLTAAYSLKVLILTVAPSGACAPATAGAGGHGVTVKVPLVCVGVGAVGRGAILLPLAPPTTLRALDKTLPLLVMGAVACSVWPWVSRGKRSPSALPLGGLRHPGLAEVLCCPAPESMWHCAPLSRGVAGSPAGAAHSGGIERGILAAGGPRGLYAFSTRLGGSAPYLLIVAVGGALCLP